MAIVKCEYAESSREGNINRMSQGRYSKVWHIEVDNDDAGPVEILTLGRAISPSLGDPLDGRGDYYAFEDEADFGSFLEDISIKLIDPKDPYHWTVTMRYGPLPNGTTPQHLTEPNPLNWDPIYWIEWVEEQVPVEEALCLGGKAANEGDESLAPLDQIFRGPSFEFNEPGPIVNAAGQQTIDPITTPKYHPILCSKRNMADLDAMNAVNLAYCDTTNDDTFLGFPARTLRYLISTAGEPVTINADGIGEVSYYVVTTKIEYKAENWVKKILNNGMVSFRRTDPDNPSSGYVQGPLDGPLKLFESTNALFECIAASVTIAAGSGDEEADEPVPVAEPVNLLLDGTQAKLTDPTFQIHYHHLTEADYTAMGF